jgi:hypothetical protein
MSENVLHFLQKEIAEREESNSRLIPMEEERRKEAEQFAWQIKFNRDVIAWAKSMFAAELDEAPEEVRVKIMKEVPF